MNSSNIIKKYSSDNFFINDITRESYKINDFKNETNSLVNRFESDILLNSKETFDSNNDRLNSLQDEIVELKNKLKTVYEKEKEIYRLNIENKKFSPKNIQNIYHLDNINNLAFEAYKLFEKSQSADFFGELLNQTWIEKKKIHKIVSNKLIDNIYEKGIEAGATGGKLLGAGAGGFILFYVEKKKQEKFLRVFDQKNYLKFNIDYNGSQTFKSK